MNTGLRRFLAQHGGSYLKRSLLWLGYRCGVNLPPVEGVEIDLPILKRWITTESPTILEIGCNDGTDTLRLAGLFQHPTIHCFEPERRAINRFREHIPEDHPHISLHEFALSDMDGEQSFFPSAGRDSELLPKGWDMSGSLRRPAEHMEIHEGIEFGPPVTVPTRRLDSWLREQNIDHIDFIWMDVQGAEQDVLKGAGEMLPQVDFIYTEYSQQEIYEGQLDLQKILNLLPEFIVERRLAGDVLLRNKQR